MSVSVTHRQKTQRAELLCSAEYFVFRRSTVRRAQWTQKNTATQSPHENASRRETQNAKNQPTPPVGKQVTTSSDQIPSDGPADSGQRFRILRRIAEGGIGTVYAAFDKDLQREVALKELKGSLVHKATVINRFLVEATITSHLEHPNIVPIYAVGQRSDGRHFYAMRFIRGQSMQSAIGNLHRQALKISSGELNFRRDPEARDLLLRFVTVCRAIGFAHSRGVIHRDLKPANIMVGDFGETLVVDWGLARRRSSNENLSSSDHVVHSGDQKSGRPDVSSLSDQNSAPTSAIDAAGFSHHEDTFISDIDGEPDVDDGSTREGTIVGTPGYMSPEQAIGRVELVNETSDIYSLGATLFCLLTNAVPIEHTGAATHTAAPTPGSAKEPPVDPAIEATMISVANQNGPRMMASPRRINASIPLALDAICQKAMCSKQEDRYRSTVDMARDLEAWLADEPVSVLPESRLQRVRRWLRQRPLLAGGLAGSVAIATIAMAITLQILSGKNIALTQANQREKEATQNAKQQAQIAAANAEDAQQQRQKIQEILHSFITDVERSLANVPDTRMMLNRVAEAKADFVTAGETADKMAAIDPKSTVARRFQSFSAEMLADIALAEEDFDNALKYAVRSLDVSLELATIDPSDHQAQRDLLLCHSKVAKVYQAKSDFPAAIAQYRLAEEIANRNYQQNPSLDATTSVIFVRAKIGETFLKAEDPAPADEILKSTIELLESIPAENRSDANLRRRMVNLPTLRARALIMLQRTEEARTLLEQARTLALDMIQKEERADQMKLDLQEIETLLEPLNAE